MWGEGDGVEGGDGHSAKRACICRTRGLGGCDDGDGVGYLAHEKADMFGY